ncbi:MAG: DUF4349 domain-containing protein [Treponema sp.]|nr:DUF4349 domain-containing protein [Candidatus Treponema caballi]
MMKKTRTFILITALLMICLLLAGCAAGGKKEAASARTMTSSAKIVSPTTSGFGAMNASYADYAVAEEAMADGAYGALPEAGTAAAGNETSVDRKLIKNGSLNLEVENLDEAEQAVISWGTTLGGYVSDSSSWKSSRSLTLRIPSERFDEAMSGIGTLGVMVSRNIYTNDVTEQFYDLQGRIQTKQILYDRLNEYLKKATNMADLISIESELNEVQSDLESMQGQMNRLSNQINFSTLSVYLELPADREEEGFQRITLGSRLSGLLSGFTTFLQYLIVGIVALIVFGIPVLLAAALLWWLCFGKIGLIRKLFQKLKK